jgi:N6-adenosine-specific RNA methylase IME4
MQQESSPTPVEAVAPEPPPKESSQTVGSEQVSLLPQVVKDAKSVPERNEYRELVSIEPCDLILVNARWEVAGLSTETLAQLPIPSVAKEDCILWLRATNRHMGDAYSVISEWGFSPKSLLTWVKEREETGEWLRDQTEHFILAVRGNPPIDPTQMHSTFLPTQERTGTSKPVGLNQLFAGMCSGQRFLEIFPDSPPKGWNFWPRSGKDPSTEGPAGKKKGSAKQKGQKRTPSQKKDPKS